MPLRVLLTLVLIAAPALSQGGDGRNFTDADLVPLGGHLAEYFEARASASGVEEAQSRLTTTLSQLARKGRVGHPLRACADLGRAFWLSRGYDRVKVRKGKVTVEDFGGDLKFAYRLPKDYDPAGRVYPLLLTIPDEGEPPARHLRDWWKQREILEEAVLVCPAMPSDLGEWDQLMVDGRRGGLGHVLNAYRLATERFAVDPDRVYAVGTGKGVPAALAAGNYGPQRFAGVIGRAGDAGEMGVDNYGNLPTYFAGAGARARAFQEAAAAAGIEHCTLDPTAGEPEIWNWILSHPRETHPTTITVVPGKLFFPTRTYWLRVAPSAAVCRGVATVDREENSIRLESTGVSKLTLFLNDALVDLDEPVEILIGDERHEVRVPRYLPTTLDLLDDRTSDAGCVYVAEVVIDASGEVSPSLLGVASPEDAAFQKSLTEAGNDVERLWTLHEWCATTGREEVGRGVLQRLLRQDHDHEAARAALGHRRSPEQWFTSEWALERFRRGQDEEIASAKGHVEYKGLWMHRDERSLLTKGRVKDHETGQWLTPEDRRRLSEGWVLQDLEWIEPEEAERADHGLWRVQGEWLTLDQANRRRARLDSMWRIPDAEVLVHSTADRAAALRAAHEMRRALKDLRRVFGAEPPLPLSVLVLRDEEQYDRFALGAPEGRRPPSHAGGLHVIHSAFFAESWFPYEDGERVFRGQGVCYWDSLHPHGDAYGVHAARLAVGLSYADALDPCPKAVKAALSKGPGPGHYAAYAEEKTLPEWLRYGGAVYAERYFHDETVSGDGDPWWARAWSLENLHQRGGLRPLREILEFPIDPADRGDGLKLLIEVGLVVAFIVDGDCAPVVEAHAEFKEALAGGRLHVKHVEALTEVLLEQEKELSMFAGG